MPVPVIFLRFLIVWFRQRPLCSSLRSAQIASLTPFVHIIRPMPFAEASPIHPLEQQRRTNRDTVSALGLNPYGQRVDGLTQLAEAKARFNPEADAAYKLHEAAAKDAAKALLAAGGAQAPAPAPSAVAFVDTRPRVKVAGRIMLFRDGGKLIWITLRDSTGDLQIAISARDVSVKAFAMAKATDLGDILVAHGPLMMTKTGEVTVWCSDAEPACKSLVTPPEKHSGLSDVELRYRQRYVDMWSNPETVQVFALRSRIIQSMRESLVALGYLEVETPMLQTLAGGAAARPFVTHMNALNISLFMRIAPELYLKRLLVGGLSKVFEINRNFRNEGLDKQHNPEFTMLEAYAAFGDCRTIMELTEGLIRDAAKAVAASKGLVYPELPFGDLKIDYGQPFRRVSYGELFKVNLGCDMTDEAGVLTLANKHHIRLQPGTHIAIVINELFERFAEKTIDPAVPTFITDYPAAISPLVRPRSDAPHLADRADLFIGGMEIAPHYTELNDPDVQAARFREQLGGIDADKAAEEKTYRTFDADFIHALKVGMPPAGGMGLGIDRLVMLLTDQRTIRDVVLFPLMKPEAQAEAEADEPVSP